MEDIFTLDPNTLPMTLKSFQKVAKAHGWKKASLVRGKESYIYATRPDGQEIQFLSGAAPGTSYFSGILADDKLASYHLFNRIGVKQPETIVLHQDTQREQLRELLQKHQTIVIKPSDGGHGNDVFVGLSDLEEADSAANAVRHNNQRSAILAQEQLFVSQPELRIICINYRFVAAFSRIPAAVTGDGEHTVKQLIDIENSTIRTAPYASNLAYIDTQMSDEYINKREIADKIPSKGEKVQVIGMCNIGRGGTVVDSTATISPEQRTLSEKIAKAFALPVIGIDFLGDYVLEVNSTPSLYYPTGDDSSSLCVEKWVDYLERLPLPS